MRKTSYSLLLASLLVLATVHGALAVDGPSYWKLDESSGTQAADTQGLNNLTGSGGSWTAAKFGNGYDIQGDDNDYLESESTDLQNTDFTIEFWAQMDGTQVNNAGFFHAYEETTFDGYILSRLDTSGNLKLWDIDFGSYKSSGALVIDLTGSFHHVVMVFNRSGNASLYVDNTLEKTYDISGDTTEQPIYNGGNRGQGIVWGDEQSRSGTGYEAHGTFDNIVLYTRALTVDEVAYRYNSGDGREDNATSAGGGPSGSLTVTPVLPTDGDHHNDDPAYFYWNVTSSENATNCTPYVVEDWTNETSLSEHSQAATNTFVLKKTFDLSDGPHRVDTVTFMGKHTGAGHTTTVRAEAIWHNGSSTYYDTTGINTNSYELETIDLPNLNVTTLKIYINETDGETAYITNISVRGNASWQAQAEQTGLANGQHNFSLTLNETTTAWYVSCVDANLNAKTTTRTVVYDSTNPDWTFNPGNFFASDNTTAINTFDTDVSSLQLNLTGDDYWLYANEILIYNASGALVYNDTDENLTVESKDFTETVNLSGYGLGQYNVTMTLTDDHTKKLWDDKKGTKITKPQRGVRFLTPEGNDIQIESDDYVDLSGVETKKLKDRYTFEFKHTKAKNTRTYTLKANKGEMINYRGDLWPYPVFVVEGGSFKNANWVDFNDETAVSYTVNKVGDDWRVTIHYPTKQKNSKIRSIGGLNSRVENYAFTLTRDATPEQAENLTVDSTGLTWAFLSWDLKPDTTGTALYFSNGTLLQNSTNLTTMNVTGLAASTSYDFYVYAWHNDSGTIYTNTTTSGENTVTATTQTNSSISFRFSDEETGSLITPTMVTLDLIIFDTLSSSHNTTSGVIGIDDLANGNYTFRYGADGYTTRFYFAELLNDTNIQQNLTLLNSSTGTVVTVTVRDTILGNPVNNATVKVQKYDVGTNSFTINQIGFTNFEGETQIDVQLNTEYYKFVIEYGGAVVFTSDPMYVYGTTLDFYIQIESTGTEDYDTHRQISGGITFNNDTGVATLEYNDQAGVATQGCLYAYRLLTTGKALYNSSCAAGASGSTNVGVAITNGTTYLFEGYATSGGEDYLLDTYRHTYQTSLPDSDNGLLLGLILVVVMALIGIWSLSAAILFAGIAPVLLSVTGLISIGTGFTIPLLGLAIIIVIVLEVKK